VVGLAVAGRSGALDLRATRPGDTDGWCQAAGHADLLWLESPSNPLLHVADLPAIPRRRADRGRSPSSTTPSPHRSPAALALGADLVLHSATKYLGGHSDLMLGAAVARDDELADRVASDACLPEPFRARRPTSPCARRNASPAGERATATAHELAVRLERHPEVSIAATRPAKPDADLLGAKP
jgi:cystathionine gamma-synthase